MKPCDMCRNETHFEFVDGAAYVCSAVCERAWTTMQQHKPLPRPTQSVTIATVTFDNFLVGTDVAVCTFMRRTLGHPATTGVIVDSNLERLN